MKKTVFVLGAGSGCGNRVAGKDVDLLAEVFWKLHTERKECEVVH